MLAVRDVGDAQLIQLGQHLVAAVHGVCRNQDDLRGGGADELIVGGGVLAHVSGGAVLNLLGHLLDVPLVLIGGHQTDLIQRPDGMEQGGMGGGKAAQLGQRSLKHRHVPRIIRDFAPLWHPQELLARTVSDDFAAVGTVVHRKIVGVLEFHASHDGQVVFIHCSCLHHGRGGGALLNGLLTAARCGQQ